MKRYVGETVPCEAWRTVCVRWPVEPMGANTKGSYPGSACSRFADGRSGEPSRTNAASRMDHRRDAEKTKALTGFPNHCVRVSAGDLHSAHWNTPFAANQATAQIMANGLRELAGGADRIEHSGFLPGS